MAIKTLGDIFGRTLYAPTFIHWVCSGMWCQCAITTASLSNANSLSQRFLYSEYQYGVSPLPGSLSLHFYTTLEPCSHSDRL